MLVPAPTRVQVPPTDDAYATVKKKAFVIFVGRGLSCLKNYKIHFFYVFFNILPYSESFSRSCG